MEWNGKSIFVAGACGGIGRQIVSDLAKHPCSLTLADLPDNPNAEPLRAELQRGKAPINWQPCDLTKAEEINRGLDAFFEREKTPYGLVNLIGDPARVDWQKSQIREMQDSFLKNASAPLHSAKEFGLRMRARSLDGAVVLFSSMQGLYPFENSLYYATAKAALVHGAKILAKEFGGDPFVRVNVVAPGVNQAGMAEESIRKGKYEKLVQQKIIPRYGNAQIVSRLVLFLLDPDLYMTGQAILYDAGLTLRRDLLR
jgi:NAD(P)-dependent dehydrogenase (short-subunit alcohol dehydrogenase family)